VCAGHTNTTVSNNKRVLDAVPKTNMDGLSRDKRNPRSPPLIAAIRSGEVVAKRFTRHGVVGGGEVIESSNPGTGISSPVCISWTEIWHGSAYHAEIVCAVKSPGSTFLECVRAVPSRDGAVMSEINPRVQIAQTRAFDKYVSTPVLSSVVRFEIGDRPRTRITT